MFLVRFEVNYEGKYQSNFKKKFISQADTKSGRNAILLHCMDMPINIGKVKKGKQHLLLKYIARNV